MSKNERPFPGRSQTLSAWSALLALFLLILIGLFYPLFLKESVRLVLWAAQPLTGVKIKSQELNVAWGKPLLWKNVTIITGQFPRESYYTFEVLSLELASPGRMLFGDHHLLNTLQAENGEISLNLCSSELSSNSSLIEKVKKHAHEFFQTQLLPLVSSCVLKNVSFSLITNTQSFSAQGVSFCISQKSPGRFSYNKAIIIAEPFHCELEKASCTTSWNGKTITFSNLSLSEEVHLHSLQITSHPEKIELGLVSTLFHGVLRADGCIRKNEPASHLEGAILAQNVPLERLSKFLGLTKKVSGNLREGRLIFRGSLAHWIDGELSLRILANNFHYEKKEWGALSVTGNLIGRKISLSDFQLKQPDNLVIAAGEIPFPHEWNKLGEIPFHLKLWAEMGDITQLGALVGPPWDKMTGKLLLEGEVQGAAHSAQGYFKAQGSDLGLHELSINSFKLGLLFKNEKTDFQCSFHNLTQGSQRISGHCEGFYTLNYWFFSQLLLQDEKKSLFGTLSISPKGIEATPLSLLDHGSLLSGNFYLPIDTKAFWEGGTLASSFVFRAPLESTLIPGCFSLTKKMLQGEPLTLKLPGNFYEPLFFFRKIISSSVFFPSSNAEGEGNTSSLDIPEKKAHYYFYWK